MAAGISLASLFLLLCREGAMGSSERTAEGSWLGTCPPEAHDAPWPRSKLSGLQSGKAVEGRVYTLDFCLEELKDATLGDV